MNEVLDYLTKCGTFYLATLDGDQPRVRPFGAVCEYKGKLYITTGNQKAVYKQMIKNNKIEMCGMYEGSWMRVTGEVKEDLSREARVQMLEANPSLRNMYSEDDGIFTVFYFESGTATISSFTTEPKVIEL